MPVDFKALRAEHEDIVGKLTKQTEEFAGKRVPTGEEKQERDKLFSRLDVIRAALEAATEDAKHASNLPEVAQFARQPQGAPALPDDPRFRGEVGEAMKFAEMRKQINEFIRTGNDNREQFTLITTTGSSVMVPQQPLQPTVIRRITNPIMATLAAYGLQPLMTPSAELIPIPVFDDSSNDAQNPAEDSTSVSTQDPTVTALTLGATLFDSKALWLSNTLLNTVGYDLLGYSEPMLVKRIDHKQHAAWVGSIKTSATAVRANSATAIAYADFVNLDTGLPIPYRVDAAFVLADQAMTAARLLTDTLGRPLYVPSMRDDVPDKLLGRPAFLTDSLDTALTANKVIAFVASAEALKVRKVTNRRLARYVNVPSYPDQFGLQLFENADFQFLTQAVRTLKMAAS